MSDNLTPSQRSYCMSRVRNKDTDLERIVRSALHKHGLRFRKHVQQLPGKPDIVFGHLRLAVFVDGDFWHGFRFTTWAHRVSPFWRRKITLNRQRDQQNFRKLRGMGWRVIRVWQHELKRNPEACILKILGAIRLRKCSLKRL